MRSHERRSRADYPDGLLAVYDNGGIRERSQYGTADRYTVVYRSFEGHDGRRYWPGVYMSERPFHPQGIGIHEEWTFRPTRGPGERCIPFGDLPEDCQRVVLADLDEMAKAIAAEDRQGF